MQISHTGRDTLTDGSVPQVYLVAEACSDSEFQNNFPTKLDKQYVPLNNLVAGFLVVVRDCTHCYVFIWLLRPPSLTLPTAVAQLRPGQSRLSVTKRDYDPLHSY